MPHPPKSLSPQSRFDLHRQVLLGTIALIVAVVLATGVAHWFQREVRIQAEAALATLAPRSALASGLALNMTRCQVAANAMEAALGQATGPEEPVRAWQSALAKYSQILKELDELALDEVDRATFARWHSQSRQYQEQFLTVLQELNREQQSTPGSQDRGGGSPASIRRALSECQRGAERLAVEAEQFAAGAIQQAKVSDQQLQTMIAERSRLINVRAIVALICLCFVFTWFSRSILSRVHILAEAIGRLKGGDLHVRIAAHSEDELGAMALQLNDLADSLQTSREQTNRAVAEHAAAAADKSGLLLRIGREYRGPLSACASFLEELLQTPDRADLRDIAVLLRQNVERLLELSECLLDLARFESGQLVLKPTACSPCELVKETSTVATHRAAAKGRRLIIEYAGQMPESIFADAQRMRQMLLQWLDGACELIPAGNLRLVVRLHTADTQHPLLQFDIAAPENARSEVASRRAIERPEASEPANLALDLAARTAKMLGGTMRTIGDPAHGGGLCVTIPTGSLTGIRLIEPTTLILQAAPRTASQSKSQLGCRVLVAEDGPENRRFLGLVLRKAGASVELAENGEQVMQMIAKASPENACDIILMDMQMPVLDGYDATRRLRQQGYEGQIIAVTAHTDAFDKQMCLQAGCNRYLAKPVDRETLLAAVAECVQAIKGHPVAAS